MNGTEDLYVLIIFIPENSSATLYYRFHAVEPSGEVTQTDIRIVNILDDDVPLFGSDMTLRNGTTGDEFEFNIEVWDNIMIQNVKVEYWFGEGDRLNATMTQNGTYTLAITLPSNSTESLHYIFHAVDGSGNRAITEQMQTNISDNDSPVAMAGEDIVAVIGELVVFNGSESHDNIGPINLTWRFENTTLNLTLNGTHPSHLFNATLTCNVTLTVADAAGNIATDSLWVTIGEATVGDVLHNITFGPFLGEDGEVLTGASVTIRVNSIAFANVTDTNGMCPFTLPESLLGMMLEVTVEMEGYEMAVYTPVLLVDGSLSEDPPRLKRSVIGDDDGDDDGDSDGGKDDREGLLQDPRVLWALSVTVAVLALAFGILLWKRKRDGGAHTPSKEENGGSADVKVPVEDGAREGDDDVVGNGGEGNGGGAPGGNEGEPAGH
jgi:hypothetical protein